MENKVTEKNNHDRIDRLLRFLNSGLYGKEEAVRLALLSAVAGESIFFLGPPGTAKSMISRRIKDSFKDETTKGETTKGETTKDETTKGETTKGETTKDKTTYFEYLLNEFSTPDEICGPVSLEGLEKGEYKRITEGYLPKANIAFLDEIWKAGPAILNTLLSIINEKKYHNGCERQTVPLISLVTASNELPPENRGLEALWDRLIIRVPVNPVQKKEDFFNVVTKPTKELEENDKIKMQENQITLNDLTAWSEKINDVNIPESVRNVITAIRQELVIKNSEGDRSKKEKYYVSDRRWKKIVHLLRTSAFLNDRNEVDLMDCQLIQYCIWSTEKQMEETRQIVEKIAQDYGLECNTAIDDINDQIEEMNRAVNSTWYEPQQPLTIASQDGTICYKTFDANNNIFYFAIDPADNHYSYGARHYYFDAKWGNQRLVTRVSISPDNKSLKCDKGDFSISQIRPRNKGLFDNSFAYNATKEKFDTDHYTPISEKIKRELKMLETVRNESEKPFSQNIFAEKSFAEMLLSKMASSKKELEDAQVELDKTRARYEQE